MCDMSKLHEHKNGRQDKDNCTLHSDYTCMFSVIKCIIYFTGRAMKSTCSQFLVITYLQKVLLHLCCLDRALGIIQAV